MTTSAKAAKAAIYTLCQSLYPEFLVSYGHPGSNLTDTVISVGNVRALETVATMSTNRTREETLQVEVLFMCATGGGPEVQQSVTERCYDLMAELEGALQGSSYNLNNAVRIAAVTSHEMTESWDPDDIKSGRLTDILAVVTCSARI